MQDVAKGLMLAVVACALSGPVAQAQDAARPTEPCIVETPVIEALGAERPEAAAVVLRLQQDCRLMIDTSRYWQQLHAGLAAQLGGLAAEERAALSEWRVAYARQQVARAAHERSLSRHAEKIFDWQLVSLRLLTFITILMTLAGLVVAAREIPRSLRPVSPPPAAPAGGDPAAEVPGGGTPHQVVLGPGNVSVTTAAAWVVMLALALGYLYLFVSEVMELEPTDFGAQGGSDVETPPDDGTAIPAD
jgi:hypothetical protein